MLGLKNVIGVLPKMKTNNNRYNNNKGDILNNIGGIIDFVINDFMIMPQYDLSVYFNFEGGDKNGDMIETCVANINIIYINNVNTNIFNFSWNDNDHNGKT